MFLERGFVFTHEAVWDWEARFAPLLTEHLRAKRRGRAGASWYVDEIYVKVAGAWCYTNCTWICNKLGSCRTGGSGGEAGGQRCGDDGW
jgi:hypothetical protein